MLGLHSIRSSSERADDGISRRGGSLWSWRESHPWPTPGSCVRICWVPMNGLGPAASCWFSGTILAMLCHWLTCILPSVATCNTSGLSVKASTLSLANAKVLLFADASLLQICFTERGAISPLSIHRDCALICSQSRGVLLQTDMTDER